MPKNIGRCGTAKEGEGGGGGGGAWKMGFVGQGERESF